MVCGGDGALELRGDNPSNWRVEQEVEPKHGKASQNTSILANDFGDKVS